MKGFRVFRSLTALVLALSVLLSIGAMAIAAPASVQTRALSQTAATPGSYLFMDFRPTDPYRNLGWMNQTKYKTGVNANNENLYTPLTFTDITYSGDERGVLVYRAGGADPMLMMPNDTTNRLNYVLKSGDVVKIGVQLDEAKNIDAYNDGDADANDGKNIVANNTQGVGSTVFMITSNGATGYVGQDTFNGSIFLKTNYQNITYTPKSGFEYAGLTLYNIRIDLLNNVILQKDANSRTNDVTARIDYIYVGSEATAPVLAEYFDENGNSIYGEYSAWGTKPTWNNHGKVNSTSNGKVITWGWEVWQSNDNGATYANTGEFVEDARTVILNKPTRFQLKAIEKDINSSKKLSTGSNAEDDSFVLTLDAAVTGATPEIVYPEPLDVTIVLDRSGSMSHEAAYDSDQFTFPIKDDEDATIDQGDWDAYYDVVNKLDKTKHAGYYRATWWMEDPTYGVTDTKYSKFTTRYKYGTDAGTFHSTDYGVLGVDPYTGKSKYFGKVYTTPLRYRNGGWEIYAPVNCTHPTTRDTYEDVYIQEKEHGIYYAVGNITPCEHMEWIALTEGYKQFTANREKRNSNMWMRILIPRLSQVTTATQNFIDELYKSTANLAPGQTHTVSILSYGYSVFAEGYPYTDSYNNHYKTFPAGQNVSFKSQPLNASTYEDLCAALTSPYVFSTTRTDSAMQVLAGIQGDEELAYYTNKYGAGTTGAATVTFKEGDYLAKKETGRQRVVILVTDGAPTKANSFQNAVADDAIEAAKKLKDDGCLIFTIGYMPGLNDELEYNSDASTDSAKANNFLNVISSNYKSASSYTVIGSGSINNDYYMAATGDGSNLMEHFKEILNKTTKEPTAAIEDSLYIYDEITREFMVDPDLPINVYAVPHTGNNAFNESGKQLLGTHKLSQLTKNVYTNFADKGYALKYVPSVSGNSENSSITLKWTDAPEAYLRNTKIKTASVVENNTSYTGFGMGYKIVMEIPLKVNRDNTIGGNNIPTNESTSGLYFANEADTEKGAIKLEYAVPNANVKPIFDMDVHDYFMDLSTLANIANAGGLKDNDSVQDVFSDVYSYDESVFTNGKNDYVQLENYVRVNNRVVYKIIAGAGTDQFTAVYFDGEKYYADVTNTGFTFAEDVTVSQQKVIRPTSNEVDSTGTDPYTVKIVDPNNPDATIENPVLITWDNSNYYGPKLAVVDFDGVISVPMGMEADPTRLTVTETKGGVYDNNSKAISYDFRYAIEDGGPVGYQWLNLGRKTIAYNFKAVNPRKGVTGEDVVNRELTIIPANNQTYDEVFMLGHTDWTPVGDTKQGAQEYNNGLRHGYDVNFNSTAGDLHGGSRVATVSEDMTYQSASFDIWGTGFEVFSRTGPDCGAMLVEICEIVNDTVKPAKKVFLVNTYLANEMLYQIPVVQCTGLTHAAYKIRVHAYYNKALDPFYDATKKALTEADWRNILGIDESVEFTYIPAVDVKDAKTTRTTATDDTPNAYNVYIDGYRVYNTRGDFTYMNDDADNAAVNNIFKYAYGLAKEGYATYENVSDLIIDVTSDVNWSAEGTKGILYIAGKGEAQNGDLTNTATDGFMLNMSGKIDYDPDGDKNYPIDKEGNKFYYIYTYSYEITKEDGTTETVTKSDSAPIYYKEKTDGKRDYYAVLKTGEASSAETMLKWDIVRNLLGQNGSVVYYDSKYDLMGPEHEIYIPAPVDNAHRGIAFNVANASAVQISVKSINGAITLEAYEGNNSWKKIVEDYDSKTELYYVVPVVEGAVILRNAGTNVLSISNIKLLGDAPEATPYKIADAAPMAYVTPDLVMMASKLFDKETPTIDDGVKIAHSLTLKSGISINYVVKAELLDKYDSFYMEVVAPVYEGNEQVGTKTYRLEPVAVGDRYYFVMNGLSAKKMNDLLQARIYMTKDDVTYISGLDEYSVASYAYNQLANAEASDELKALCANLLRYGAEAQLHWSYRTDALANEELAAEHAGYLKDLDSVELKNSMAMINDLEAPTASWKSATLALENKIVMRFIANLATYTGDIQDLSARVSYVNHDGEKVTTVVDKFELLDAQKKLYAVDCDALDADELRMVVSAAIYCGDTQISRTAQYSVESYAAKATGNLVSLCMAMMAYGDSVEEFFH